MRFVLHRSQILLCSSLVLVLASDASLAVDAAVGVCGPGTVEVCGTVYLKNTTSGAPATDLHFYMYQNDRASVQVSGATVSVPGCTSATVTLGTDNGKDVTPPAGNHGAQIDIDGCSIQPETEVPIKVCLCMNERNCVKFKDIKFTQAGTPIPPDPNRRPPDKSGWRNDRPFPKQPGGDGGSHIPGGAGRGAQEGNGGNGNWIHQICYENDSNDWLIIDELKLLASMANYPNHEPDWFHIDPVVDPAHPYPICIPPGSRYCFLFQTTGSYVGGHIYQKWSVRVDTTGQCPPHLIAPATTSAAPGPESDTTIVGDHPVEAELADCLPGMDFFQTVQPTFLTFGTPLTPQIPAGFFGPGSEPFNGTVAFMGVPIDPAVSQADTIIERKQMAYLDFEGASATIPIELTALQLQSTAPIMVHFTNGEPLWFDVPGIDTTLVGQPPTHVSGGVAPGGDPDFDLKKSLPSASISTRLVDRDGTPSGTWAVDSFFDIFYQAVPPVPSTRFFDILFDLSPMLGTGNFPMPAPVLSFNSTSFSVQLGDIPLGGGRTARLGIGAQVTPTQPLQIANVSLLDYTGSSRFRLRVQTGVSGAIALTQPILTGHMTGHDPLVLDSLFKVFFTKDADLPAIGSMNITRAGGAGGTFTSQYLLRPRLTFLRSGAGQATAPMPGVAPRTIAQFIPQAWTFAGYTAAPASAGPNFFPDTLTALVWSDPDGMPHTVTTALAPPHAIAWRSLHQHGPLPPNHEIGVVLDPAAAGNGSGGPTVETRSGGLQRVQVDFDQPVVVVGSPVLLGNVTSGGSMGPQQDFSGFITAAFLADPDTAEILLSGLPETACYRLDIGNLVSNMAGMGLAGDLDCKVRTLPGDASGDGIVSLQDALDIKALVLSALDSDFDSVSRPTASRRPRYDLNLNGGLINLADALAAKARVGQQALCP